MAKKMLIDATHPEETRVAVVSGNRLEELDYETAAKKHLKGNIYLAKIVRVEPSLQAAFVDYGGNRHGFLAFSEIHPDYYRIPVADREALIAEEAAFAKAEERVDEFADEEVEADAAEAGAAEGEEPEHAGGLTEPEEGEEDRVIEAGGDDEIEEARRGRSFTRRYNIQEVIKRRQVMLVQVTKEERGTKGAALTTRLSLAGRYCVLMPNTGRGGGVSRKITNTADRKSLRAVIESLNIPEGISVIMRTAGAKRTKAEIKRDYEYLLRLWSDIREITLKSKAPSLIYEEANLIKRAIRDLYSRDMEEVLVEGEEGYHNAKTFMRTLMPSHAKRVQPYKDGTIPLFHRYQIESQIDAIHNPVVRLKSGGYVVINQTEALVAIDVNSGRATRERNIEETALKTNVEAADEVARQLRLRDLAGLIVIDFIDMETPKNQRTVEKRLKEAMKADRARIQLGHISAFGLLELSRQRLRPSLSEISSQHCPYCDGTGVVRSTESTALHVLRAIEEEGIRGHGLDMVVSAPTEVVFYILNQKRHALREIEDRYGFSVFVDRDDSLIPPDFRMETAKPGAKPAKPVAAAPFEVPGEAETAEEEAKGRRRPRRRRVPEAEPEAEELRAEAEEKEEAEEDKKGVRKRRRRGKRGGRRRSRKGAAAAGTEPEHEAAEEAEAPEGEAAPAEAAEAETAAPPAEAEEAAKAKPAKRVRRRRARPAAEGGGEPAEPTEPPEAGKAKPVRKRRARTRAPKAAAEAPEEATEAEEKEPQPAAAEPAAAEPAAVEPAPTEQPPGVVEEVPARTIASAAVADKEAQKAAAPKRKGWWQRFTQ
jgi:ribonuclease E